MKQYLYLLTISLFFSGGTVIFAQIAEGGTPASFDFQEELRLQSEKNPYRAPINFDVVRLKAEDKIAEEAGMLLRTSVIIPVDLSMEHAGEWSVLPNGIQICRLIIQAPEAIAVMLYYDRFFIPSGGKLFIYNAERTHLLGAYTSDTNPDDKKFATEFVAGDEIILEYNEPQLRNDNVKPDIRISGIGYGYNYLETGDQLQLDTKPGGFNSTCQVNINCPEGNDWQDQKKGVAKTVAPIGNPGNGYLCSGSLVNNTAQDLSPYYLSAHHCFDDSGISFDQIVFYFHYESQGCTNSTPTSTKTIVGAQLLVDLPINGSSDGALLKLNSNIPSDYGVYYNGWDRRNTAATNGVGIHHPKGDIKKISTFTTPVTNSRWTGEYGPGAVNAHWQVIFAKTQSGYSQTDNGSSGSPLFNQNGLVVGTLTGGTAINCTSGSTNYYGKLWYHWDNANAAGTKTMKDYLDPFNTGVDFLNGTYSVVAGNTDLISLTVNPGTLVPAFSPSITGYTVNVASGTESITVSATSADVQATVTGTGNHPLNVGNNTIRVVVTAPDQSTSRVYTVTVRRAAALSPDMYEPDNTLTQAYSLPLSFTNNTATVKTTGSNFHNETDIDYYKIELPSGYNYSISSMLYDLYSSDGENTYTVDAKYTYSTDGNRWSDEYDDIMEGNIVIVNGGTVYFLVTPYFEGDMGDYLLALTIERRQVGENDDADLSELSISSGVLVFNSNIPNYTVTVGNSISRVIVAATVRDPNAMVSGVGYHEIQIGNNTIPIVVTAQNGITQRTYTIIVVRRAVAGNNTDLQNLTVDHGTLYPFFSSIFTNYSVTVDREVSEINVYATAVDENATITGTGNYPLNIGNNEIDIIVTAENGSTFRTYIINVARKSAYSANLSNLSVDPGTLIPAFNPNITMYSVYVDDDVEGILIIGEPADANAEISGNGYYLLEQGRNTIDLVVTSPDNTATRTYTVIVVRELINGVENSYGQPLLAYPNPAHEQIVVSGLNGNGTLTVFDVAGRQWIRRNIASSEEIISVRSLPSGSYFIQVIEGKNIRTIKVQIIK